MAQRQFLSSDTDIWYDGFGSGVDGSLTISGSTTFAPTDSTCTGTVGTYSLSATNASFSGGKIILIHQSQGSGAGAWELNKIASYSAGTITTVYPLTNTYGTGAQVLVLPQYSDVTINTGVVLTGKVWTSGVGGIVAYLVNGAFTINGTGLIDIKGKNATFGNGGDPMGFEGGDGMNQTGEGTAGAKTTGASANGNGGGAGVSGSLTGGGGGNATSGSNGSGGAGGNASGNTGLTLITFGGGAGGGGNGGSSDGAGGGGGGIVIIIAKSISFAGSSAINGNGGDGKKSSGGGTGGSAGAGGSVLLKGQTVSIGTNLITVNAGSQDNGSISNGAAGSVGRAYIYYKDSVSGSMSPSIGTTQDSTLYNKNARGSFFLNLV